MHLDSSHPRYASLKTREKLVWGVKKGLTSTAGLLAHGRGEAFDYIIGERTTDFAKKAITAASAYLLLSENKIISTNGNSTALSAVDLIKSAKLLDCKIEVNLFHFSQKRQKAIENYLNHLSAGIALDYFKSNKMVLSKIASHRKNVIREGIGMADTVLVPLEDGDRTQALTTSGKKVIAIDLNPLSRTSREATVTIVDNITRALPLLIIEIKRLRTKPKKYLENLVSQYNNADVLREAVILINNRLNRIAKNCK